jgi:transcriptional regulator with XRE-family HTH domain
VAVKALRVLREERGLTQSRAAKACGLTQTTISMLELGQVPDPRWSTLGKLARGYKVPVPTIVRAVRQSVAEYDGIVQRKRRRGSRD